MVNVPYGLRPASGGGDMSICYIFTHFTGRKGNARVLSDTLVSVSMAVAQISEADYITLYKGNIIPLRVARVLNSIYSDVQN